MKTANSHPRPSRLNAELKACCRPSTRGKFLYIGDAKFHVRGVTYGTFRADGVGREYPDSEIVEQDFAKIAESGFNAVRTYTVPPCSLFDAAQRHGLRVMVGLPWEQHTTFLDDPRRQREIEERLREGVRGCAQHPALLCYAIGNEIPSPIARWYGSRPLERFLERLYKAAKEEDPGGLFTYVNYPSTEYLRLPFVDFMCFNVYLESQQNYEAYLARLQNLAEERPLLMGEIGMDSRRNGEEGQARSVSGYIRTAMNSGCAGAFVYAWTDEWHRGGFDIEDWDFGLVTRDRKPKPALAAVRNAFSQVPFPKLTVWPRITIVVCTYNGGRTLAKCMTEVFRLDYPDYEVIVVNDGSTDQSGAIVSQYPCRLINTDQSGLSSARNTGLAAAAGEIVAYLDDDAYPDPHWLKYLASTFLSTSHCGVGGPNLIPPEDPAVAQCVGNAPGGPIHVLLTDSLAEHIPGCNMAFRKSSLTAIGGFDSQFHIAGDDVDVCWRLQEMGWSIGFNPAAQVWHHRRDSIWAYLKQQRGYGQAEALLHRKWPAKFNVAGHPVWSGRLYGAGLLRALGMESRVYHGDGGSAAFQTLHESPPNPLTFLPSMPEWLLIILFLASLSALGLLWQKLLWVLPLLALAVGLSVYQAAGSAFRTSRFGSVGASPIRLLGLRLLTFLLHLLQPMARLWGRVGSGLLASQLKVPRALARPSRQEVSFWCEKWREPQERLRELGAAIRENGGSIVHGGAYDRWDLEVRGGMLAAVRFLMTVEEHGMGRQMFRYRLSARSTALARLAILPPTILAVGAALDGAWPVAAILGGLSIFLIGLTLAECSSAMAVVLEAIRREHDRGLVSSRQAPYDSAALPVSAVGLVGDRPASEIF